LPPFEVAYALQITDQLANILRSLGGLGPEIFLALALAGLVVADLILGYKKATHHRRTLYALAAVSLLVTGLLVIGQASRPEEFLFNSLLFLDGQAVFFKCIVTGAALVAVLHAWLLPTPAPRRMPLDWLPLLLGLLFGLLLMTMAVNLLTIYLSLELVSLSSYMLTGLATDRKASEGGIKYLLFGAVSSAIMLYGISLLYGLTGTLDLTSAVVESELTRNGPYVVFMAGFLVLVGLFFKLSLVPFHAWTPDTYEAAPTPVVAFFSVAPKAAALLVLMRVLTALPVSFQTPMAVLALASITLGNLSALRQTDAKRLLAYSTIAHAGFLLVGLVAFNQAGFEAATFYVATYLFINMAAFLLIDVLARTNGGRLTLADFSGLGSRQPLLSLALTVVMIALTGLPPTVGFTAKLLAFSALWQAYQEVGDPWLLALFTLGLLNAVVSLFYYLRLPFLLYFREPAAPAQNTENTPLHPFTPSPLHTLLALALTFPILLFFFRPDWLMVWISSL